MGSEIQIKQSCFRRSEGPIRQPLVIARTHLPGVDEKGGRMPQFLGYTLLADSLDFQTKVSSS